MFVDKVWDFKSFNMGRELEVAGEFLYDSAKKTMSITGLHNQYEINMILYTGSVGIERLQKIYLCLIQKDPTDSDSMPKCIWQHNHLALENEIEKHTKSPLQGNSMGLLGIFEEYYNKFRYSNYVPGVLNSELKNLFARFLKKVNKKFDFDEPYAQYQFEAFKRFYINELGKLAVHYYRLIEEKAREINTYTYEIDSFSNAARVLWSTQRRSLYDQMTLEQEATKELLLYLYKNHGETNVFKLLNEMDPLDLDDSLMNDYLSDFCIGKVDDSLIDSVEDLYEEIEDKKKRDERKGLLSLIGNTSVIFDYEEDDEDEEDQI